MKRWAIIALCFASTFANASEMEEVVGQTALSHTITESYTQCPHTVAGTAQIFTYGKIYLACIKKKR